MYSLRLILRMKQDVSLYDKLFIIIIYFQDFLWLLAEYFSDNKFECKFPSFSIHLDAQQFSVRKRL